MRKLAFIYKITNAVNGKIYIGKTTRTLALRLKEHRQPSKVSQSPVHRAVRKYGPTPFSIDMLEEVSIEDMDTRETYYIELLNSRSPSVGYNVAPGGEGGDMRASTRWVKSMQNRDYSGSNNPNFGKYGKDSPNFGTTRPKEFGETHSKRMMEAWSSLSQEELMARSRKISGSRNGMYGKKPIPPTPVVVDGVSYKTKADACRKLKISSYLLNKKIKQ